MLQVDSDLSSAEQVIRTIENIDWKADPLTVDASVDGNVSQYVMQNYV
jgi:hypothetical protein